MGRIPYIFAARAREISALTIHIYTFSYSHWTKQYLSLTSSLVTWSLLSLWIQSDWSAEPLNEYR